MSHYLTQPEEVDFVLRHMQDHGMEADTEVRHDKPDDECDLYVVPRGTLLRTSTSLANSRKRVLI